MRLLGKDEHPVRLAFLAAVLSLVYLAILLPAGFLESARLRSYDAYCRWRTTLHQPPKESSDLLLVAVDEESQRRLGKKWPWDRNLFAEFLNKLSKAQPGAVVLDFVLSGAGNAQSDQALAQAIRSGPPILLASYLDRQGDPVLPHALFTDAGGRVGLINHPRDMDLTVRKFFAGIRLPMQPQPLFATEIQAAAIHRRIPPDQIRLDARSTALELGTRRIPLEAPVGCVAINYMLTPARLSTVSFWQVMEDQVRPEQIRGKMVLVGSTREITHDIYPTPLGVMPGVVISANGILTLLTGRFVRPLPILLTLPLGFTLVLCVLLMTYGLPILWAGLATGILTLCCAAIGFLSVLWFNVRAESLSIFILAAAAWTGAVLYKYLLLFTESARLHRHVLTDPASGAVTERYFHLRMEADWPRWKRSRRPASMLVVQMDPISIQLQQSAWPEVQKKLQSLVETFHLRLRTTRGALVGRLKKDRLAIFLPDLDLSRAKAWVETIRSALQSVPGHLSFGLACKEQAEMPSATHLLLCADAASSRAWSMEDRRMEVFTSADKILLPDAAGEQGKPDSHALEYVASELEDRNLAIEQALNDLRLAYQEMENHFLEVTKSLVMALETKDEYTAGHLERVSRYSTRLAEVLRLPKEEIEAIREAALLHDIGKIGLPDEVLHKVGRLTDEEVAIIRQHLAIGAKILEPMKFFKPITRLIYHHHERFDGKGYPHGLTGEFIPSGAQVICIADSFDAMTTHRGYNKPLNVHEALEELRKGSGTQFNPAYVEAFIQVVQREGPHLAGTTSR